MLISFSLILENLVDYLLKESKLPQVCWENGRKGNLMHIPFDGVPFVLLSTREYQCHQGKDKNVSKKMKYRENQHQKLCSDHPQHIKTRKLSQPTKKLDCPVRFQVKKIYRFPKFAIIKDTKHLRDINSKALKEVLGKLKLDKKTLFEESFGHLEYVCMIPPGMI